jgi:O-antigen/teichoic acid export membrane protein
VLAVCGGGGSEALAWLIIVVAFAAWLAVTILIIRAARDRTERHLLLGLLIGSIVLGPLLVAAFYGGVFGSNSNVGKLAVLLLIPAVLGAGIAHRTRAAHSGRAFLVSIWGALFLIGAVVILLVATVAVGNGCLELE